MTDRIWTAEEIEAVAALLADPTGRYRFSDTFAAILQQAARIKELESGVVLGAAMDRAESAERECERHRNQFKAQRDAREAAEARIKKLEAQVRFWATKSVDDGTAAYAKHRALLEHAEAMAEALDDQLVVGCDCGECAPGNAALNAYRKWKEGRNE